MAGILDKAKDATGAAAEKAAAFKERASSVVSSLTEQASVKASEIFEAGFDQVTQAVADFNITLPVVREAGYALADMTVEMSIAPRITASFTVAEALSDEQTERIAQDHADSKLAVMIVRTLHRAGKLQSAIRVGSLRPLGLSISIGLSPFVAIKFG